ncbi:hypothetical protein chiPu_0019559 [Chiloscyllium punctatum]|uniref:Uncharacterized protein n=1 Tax=Chiloscyllium punctatum TaxID=137246 RepID=A0A401RSI1_CHIPU|nr:hypothetical protein [Chiloscyllium punctatum]
MEKKTETSSPQKQSVKNRSKSTDEVLQAKKAFHTPQISLPGRPELERLKEATETAESSDNEEASIKKVQD